MNRRNDRRLVALLAALPLALLACNGPGAGNTGTGLDGGISRDLPGDSWTPGPDSDTSSDTSSDTTTAPTDTTTPPTDTANPPVDTYTPPADTYVPPSGPVDPNCIDGKYTEAMPTPNANIAGILSAYSASDEKQFSYDLLDARWPIASYLLEGGIAQGGVNGTSDDCFDYFRTSYPGGSDGVIKSLSTVVHECAHGFDSANFGSSSTYEIHQTLSLSCPSGGGTPPWGDGSTPPRSDLQQDQWESLHPSCENFNDSGCNSYGYIYLGQQGSEQGFNTVLEETLQYINSLGTDYALLDQANQFGATSARDGLLTFLWFVERYLHLARTKHPSAYTLLTNTCWRNAILTVWGRAWLYLDATDGIGQLGINDDMLMGLVMDDVLLNEIQLLREAGSCN